MKHELELCDNLDVKQGEIVDFLTEQNEGESVPHVTGVVTHTGAVYRTKAVILCTGTYLKGKIIIGGAAVTSSFAEEIGADGYSRDAAECVQLVKKLLA
jgi:tRNA U34 5-carboxymethylaminomethyl modifying enzyme MnmG/GidA